MTIEYEATFPKIDKDEMRKVLKSVGAKLVRAEYLQKRVVFKLPEGHDVNGGWVRVRDEGDKITMTMKRVDGDRIENQTEINLVVDTFDGAIEFLLSIGCRKKAFQESKRELWTIDGVEVTIDEWPFLDPFVEVEGKSEEVVKLVSEKLGFDYTKALFCSVTTLYNLKYGVRDEVVNDGVGELLFDGQNPFLA